MRLTAILCSILLTACAVNPGVSPLGSGKYHVSRQGATGASSIGVLQKETLKEAQEFCAKNGKDFEVLGQRQSKPPYILGNFPRAEVEFACK